MGFPTILPPFARTWRKRFFLVDPRWRWGPFLLRLLKFFALQKVLGLRKKTGDVWCWWVSRCFIFNWGLGWWGLIQVWIRYVWVMRVRMLWNMLVKKKEVLSKVGTVSVMSEAWIPVCMRRFCTSQVDRIMAKWPSVRRRHKEGWRDIGMNNEGQVPVERLKYFECFVKSRSWNLFILSFLASFNFGCYVTSFVTLLCMFFLIVSVLICFCFFSVFFCSCIPEFKSLLNLLFIWDFFWSSSCHTVWCCLFDFVEVLLSH